MADGLFPFSRGTVTLDMMPVAMLVTVPLLSLSIYLVRFRHKYRTHAWMQGSIAALLMVAIIFFEIDVRLNDWRRLAIPSPYYESWLFPELYLHLLFAVTATLLWAYMIGTVIKNRPIPGSRNSSTARHRYVGMATATLTIATAISGCAFYWMAFVAC